MSNIIGRGGVMINGTRKTATKAIRQHKAMAEGYQVAGEREYKIDTGLKSKETGGSFVPSWIASSPDR